MNIKVKCPACGMINNIRVNVDGNFPRLQIVSCDIDEGGCEADFVVGLSVTVNTQVFELTRIKE